MTVAMILELCKIKVHTIYFHWKCLFDFDIGQTDLVNALGYLFNRCIFKQDKISQTRRWHFVCLFPKFQMLKHYDRVDLETKFKVKLIKGLVIMHLWIKYQICTLNGYWFMDICLSYWLWWKIELWTIKARNEDTVILFWICLPVLP